MRMTSRFGRFVLAVCLPLALAASASAAGPNKCSSAKLKATGKKASARAKCYSKAVAKGAAVDPNCLSKASLKFSTAFSKAETKGACLAPNGDEGAIEAKVDTFVDNVRSIVNNDGPGPNPCDSKKIAAAGKKAASKDKCQAKAVAKGTGVDPTCLSKAEIKFGTAVTKAENAGGCTHTGQTNALESAVDSFINDQFNELTANTTTTTTTTTTTNSTTTTTNTCGNGSIEPGEECDGSDIGDATCAQGSPAGAFPDCNANCKLDCSPCTHGCTIACAAIVPNQPIANTYRLLGQAGPKICQTNSTANALHPCNSDADCGGNGGTCIQTPWITADGFAFQFPVGISTTFTIAAADSAPTCEHSACISCGNPGAACAGIPGCGAPPGAPQNGCTKNTCCDTPGFTVPTFFVPVLGGYCGRVDQIGCGAGVVNTSRPQTGDNEVAKAGDTSDPGADCTYGTGDDCSAPLCKACTPSGQGSDQFGKVVKTIGNGSPDAAGIHYRIPTPMLATVWSDSQSPSGTCAPGSTFDAGEQILEQLILSADPTTAGATGSFTDLNGDGCARAGSGFSPSNLNGPVIVGTS